MPNWPRRTAVQGITFSTAQLRSPCYRREATRGNAYVMRQSKVGCGFKLIGADMHRFSGWVWQWLAPSGGLILRAA